MGYDILLSEMGEKMIEILLIAVFYSEVIHNQSKLDGLLFISEETWCKLGWVVSSAREMLNYIIVSELTCLR